MNILGAGIGNSVLIGKKVQLRVLTWDRELLMVIRDITISWRVTVGINWGVSIGSISGDAEKDDGA